MSDRKIKRLDNAWNAQHKASTIESGVYSPLDTVRIEHTVDGIWSCPTTKAVYTDIYDLYSHTNCL